MNDKSIELLNRSVADELAAVHQYLYFHFHCDDQGYGPLAELFRRTAIQEMGHIEELAERIIFLGGDVEMVAAQPVKKVTEVKAMLEMARQMEDESAREYNQFANQSAENADAVTKKIFEALVADEERHFNLFDNEVKNIEKFGDQYLALQSMGKGEEE